MGKIVLFDSVKGGVGKSTLLAQFAVALSREYKVAIMDCDPQESILKWVTRRFEKLGDNGLHNIDVLEADVSALKNIKSEYDFVLVDSAGADTKTGRTILFVSDIVISPLQPTQAALDTISMHNDILTKSREYNSNFETYYVLNDCSTHSKDQEAKDTYQFINEFKQDIKGKFNVVHQFIYSRKILKTSFSIGETCFDGVDNKSRAEIQSVISEII